jgi:tetratricopeptide (TPR) repeat protein
MPMSQTIMSSHTQRLQPSRVVQQKRNYEPLKPASFLRPDNRIHTLFELQSKLYKPGTIRHAYDRLRLSMEGLRSVTTQGSLKDVSTSRQLQSMYQVLTQRSVMTPSPYHSLTESLLKNEHDCDTAAIVLMAMGDEMGANTGLVVLTDHVVLAIEDQLSKTTLYLDRGQLLTALDLTHKYNLGVNDLTLLSLKGNQVDAYFENNTAINLALKGNVDDSLSLLKSAITKAPEVEVFARNLAVSETGEGEFAGAMGTAPTSVVEMPRPEMMKVVKKTTHPMSKELPGLDSFIAKYNPGLRSDNRIHALFYLYSKTYAVDHGLEKVIDGYHRLNDLISKMKIAMTINGSSHESTLALFRKAYEVLEPFVDTETPYSLGNRLLLENLQLPNKLDCDTHVYLLLSLSDELGLNSGMVVLPNHSFLLVKDENKDQTFSFDFGQTYSREAYIKHYGISRSKEETVLKSIDGDRILASYYKSVAAYMYLQGNYEEALAYANDSIRIAPDVSAFWSVQGTIMLQLNQLDKAEESLKNAVDLNDQDKMSWNKLSKVYYNKGKFLDSIQALFRSY